VENLERIIRAHPFFAGLDDGFCALVCGCAKNVRFAADDYLLREGAEASEFFLVRAGRVALEIAAPGHGTLRITTLGEGEIVGVSWLIPPYRWSYDARALESVRAISIDARCLRDKCEEDHHLGYEMMKRVVPIVANRLQAARMQLLDLYSDHG